MFLKLKQIVDLILSSQNSQTKQPRGEIGRLRGLRQRFWIGEVFALSFDHAQQSEVRLRHVRKEIFSERSN